MNLLLYLATAALAGPAPQAPPPSVSETRAVAPAAARPGLHAGEPYSIGEPTDEEQLYLELINRARAHPAAEAGRLAALTDPDILSAYRYFGVDLGMMEQEAAQLPAAPPLAMSARLTAAARGHSQDMLAGAFQGHTGSDGGNPGARITAAGYAWSTYGENVFAYAESVLHGHAGFFVDWGNGPGGMQSPRGHRDAMVRAVYREAGIGVVQGRNGDVGPQLVTQKLASAAGAAPFLTGVIYYDLNGNGAYDLGEGLGGVLLTAAGVAGSAVSAGSGGYALPVPANGTFTVEFNVPGAPPLSRTASVSAGQNVKLDLALDYPAPRVSGPAAVPAGAARRFSAARVPGATGYLWRANRRAPYTDVLDAESGLAGLAAETTPGYPVISAVRATGSAGYHLAHPSPDLQTLTVLAPLRAGPAAALHFASRLGWASVTQRAVVAVSTDDGATWMEAWSQPGTGSAGEVSFRSRSVDLSPWAGRVIRVRFAYAAGTGSYYPQTGGGTGWHLDDIRFEDVDDWSQGTGGAADSDGGFSFTAAGPGEHLLSVRALTGARLWPWGPELAVEARTEILVEPPEFAGLRVTDTGEAVQIGRAHV